MLLMNTSDPTFMVSTAKPHRLPTLDHDYMHQNLKSTPFSLNLSTSLNNMCKNTSDSTAISYSKPKISTSNHAHFMVPYIAIAEDAQAKNRDNRNSLFGVQVPVDCTGDGGDGGGRIYRGGDDDDDDDDANYHENDGADVYYESMIEANPKNSLILGNYAKYLKEVRCDFTKSMEYCNRSIVVDPNDGIVLSMYADLIWATQNDAARAEIFFKKAVEVSPHDCHILASYAGFLWDAE